MTSYAIFASALMKILQSLVADDPWAMEIFFLVRKRAGKGSRHRAAGG
jgi:hypothetical protein